MIITISDPQAASLIHSYRAGASVPALYAVALAMIPADPYGHDFDMVARLLGSRARGHAAAWLEDIEVA